MAKLKVLFVDDDASTQEVICTRINSWGYDAVQALNGKEALDLLKSEAPDAIILDYMMPDKSGVEVLREIRRIDKSIPVIMFTAYPDSKVMKDVGELDISAFIPKMSLYAESQSALRTALQMIEKGLRK